LGKYERRGTWQKPQRKSQTAPRKIWRSLPAQLTLCLIRYPVCIPGFRPREIVLATTRLDPVVYPVAELSRGARYARALWDEMLHSPQAAVLAPQKLPQVTSAPEP
jgi:hypothetical protein